MLKTTRNSEDKKNIYHTIINSVIKNNDIKKIKSEVLKRGEGRELFEFICNNIDQKFKRREYLISALNNFTNDNINISGFITFRLKEYNKHLDDTINELIIEYNANLEYQNYIFAIKKTIENQHRMIYELKIIPDNDIYRIYDEHGNNLNGVCSNILFEEFSYDFGFGDDFLLSAIITLAPIKIHIYNYNNTKSKRLIQTLKTIYGNNFKYSL